MPKVSCWPFVLPGLALGLAGCGSALPQVGPNARSVVNQSVQKGVQRYEVVEIDAAVLRIVRQREPDTFYTSFGRSSPSRSPTVGVGDAVSVTIWEAAGGGLFSSAATNGLGMTSSTATIPEQVVKPTGTISIPFVGEVRAAGRTTAAIQSDIVRGLAGKAIEPQALVTVTKAVSSTVTVTGEVVAGARVPLSGKGDRVLDVIAAAGGVRSPVSETFIQLSRGDRTIRVSMDRVVSEPRENVYVQPGDVLTVVRDPQVFLAYGATSANAEIPFNSSGVSLATALVKAGGLQSNRSDAAGVFVMRYEPEFIARQLKPNSALIVPGGLTPVVYRLDMHDPASMFVAQQFPIFNRDVLYVTDAPIVDLQKALQVFTMISQPATTGTSLYTAVR